MDCQICINTPVTSDPSSVRTAHMDDVFEFYMRPPNNTSEGGDLEIYRKTGKLLESGQPEIEVESLVKYGVNVFVMFIGTKDSVHGVTPRAKCTVMCYSLDEGGA